MLVAVLAEEWWMMQQVALIGHRIVLKYLHFGWLSVSLLFELTEQRVLGRCGSVGNNSCCTHMRNRVQIFSIYTRT